VGNARLQSAAGNSIRGESMRRQWWWVCVLLLCQGLAVGASRPAIGKVAPTALGKDKEGADLDLAKFRGKVVVVTFWAAWCGFCLKELPALNALQTHTGDKFLQIVAVNVKDGNSEYRAIARRMRDYRLVFTRDRSGEIAERYGVSTFPNLWIIDPRGRIASRHTGYGEDSLETIVSEIRRVLLDEVERQERAAAAAAAAG
jgi:thiol-disulfide isomerase/thioredoxin